METFQHLKAVLNHQLDFFIDKFQLTTLDIVFWTVVGYILLRFLWIHRLRMLERIFWTNIKRKAVQRFLSIPSVARKIDEKLEKSVIEVREEFRKNNPAELTKELAEQGTSWDYIDNKLKQLLKPDHHLKESGRLSGMYYTPLDEQFEKEVAERSSPYLYYNLMHVDKVVGVRQAEVELISWFIQMMKGDQNSMGVSTSGGTESILLAVLSFREVARIYRGITEPELILPASAHSAFFKACFYFKIRTRVVPLDPKTFTVDLKKLKARINKNTIGVICSACNYPHGIVDPIPQVAEIVRPYKLPIHVDCCLGGYSMIFSEELGFDVPKFNFEIPEVTTISIDPHKYGMAPKGISLLLFRNPVFKKASIFVQEDWAGGVYGTPSITGSRPSASMIGGWMATLRLGKEGLREGAKSIHDVLVSTVGKLKQHSCIQIIGNPQLNTFAFCLKAEFTTFSIFQVAEALTRKGWYAPILQFPSVIHMAITRSNMEQVRDSFAETVSVILKELSDNPGLYGDSKSSQIYCSKLKVPDGCVIEQAIKNVIAEFSVA